MLMQTRTRTLIVLIVTVVFFASCSRAITPYEAANGKAKCGRSLR